MGCFFAPTNKISVINTTIHFEKREGMQLDLLIKK
jgi:hypothetical protein